MELVEPLTGNWHGSILTVLDKQEIVVQASLGWVVAIFTESELIESLLVWVIIVDTEFHCLSSLEVARENDGWCINSAIFVWSRNLVSDRVAAHPTVPGAISLYVYL